MRKKSKMEGNNKLWRDYCEASRRVCNQAQEINDIERQLDKARAKFAKWTKILDERSVAYDQANQRGALPRPFDDPSKDWHPQSIAHDFAGGGDTRPEKTARRDGPRTTAAVGSVNIGLEQLEL